MINMYLEMEEEKIKKIEEITVTDYEAKGNMIPVKNIYSLIDDLLYEINCLNEKIEDMQNNFEEHYQPKIIICKGDE